MSLSGLNGGHVLLSWVRTMNPVSKIVVDSHQDLRLFLLLFTKGTSTETVLRAYV